VACKREGAFSALTLLVGRQEGHLECKKTEWWGAGVVVCLERGADLHMAQLMPLPLTVSCFSRIQIGLPFWYRLTWVVPDKGSLNARMCVCVVCNGEMPCVCAGTWFLPASTAIGAGLYSIALYGGLVVFGGFLLYDTQKIIYRAETHPVYAMQPYDPVNKYG